MMENHLKKNAPLQLPARRCPRGYTIHSLGSKSDSDIPPLELQVRDSTRGPGAKKEATPRPLEGENWRVELVAYALEIFFVYIEEEGFAQVNLSLPIVQNVATNLSLSPEGKIRLSTRHINIPNSPHSPQNGKNKSSIVPMSIDDNNENENGKERVIIKTRGSSTDVNSDESQGVDMQSVQILAAKLEKRIDIESLPSLFVLAQEEIFNLMQSDSFRRYVRSHLYRDLVDAEKKTRIKLDAMATTKLYAPEQEQV